MTEASAASVLLVDDTPANLLALEAVLEPLGVRLVSASSGREAVARVATEPFALVLLDVQMPEMDGFDVARQLRAMEYGRETPIIFLTAIHRDDTFARRGYSIGGADYITKPFDPDILRARVRAFVDLFNQRETLRAAQVEMRTRERDEAMRQLVAFERIATTAFESDELDQFLRTLLGLLVESADAADSATVLLREGDELRTAVSIGTNEEVETRGSMRIGHGFAGTVAATRRSLHVRHAAESPIVESAWLRARGTRALFGLPLVAMGEVVGVVQIGSRTADDFTANDKRLMTLIAERAASAIVRQRMLRAHLRRTELLARAGSVLAASLDPDETIARAARVGLPELGACCIVDRAEPGGALQRAHCAAASGAAEAARSDVVATSIDPASDAARDVAAGKTVVLREPAAIAAALASSAAGRAAIARLAPKSAVLAPLTARATHVGVIAFVATERGHDADDVATALELARTAALAIDNARLFDLAEREKKSADEANRLKDEFLATMSHELRTPLNAILGWTSMLRRSGGHDSRTERGLEVVERSAIAQRRLIEDLLDVSRVVSGKMRVAIHHVSVARLVESVVETMRPAADAKGIRMEMAPVEPAIGIAADVDRLQQVLGNLVQNAVKFTERGGRVSVKVERDGDATAIVVEDDGCGIDPAFLPRVFEAFRQADGSSTRAHGGLGLGLSIARHIVELHGGTLEAHSEGRGKGARFVVRIPDGRPDASTGRRVSGLPAAG
jgi:signal transduction histidine kinase/DNA-binding response OmpR family regulator